MGSKSIFPAVVMMALVVENLCLFTVLVLDRKASPGIAEAAAEPAPKNVTGTGARILSLDSARDNQASVGRAGAVVPYCSVAGCDTSGSHLLAHAYLKTTTDGKLDAQTVGASFDFVNDKGRISRWHPGTRFSNEARNLPPPAPSSYVVTGAEFTAAVYHNSRASCVSSPSGSGPTGTGSAIVDGTCLWDYVGKGLNSGGTNVAVSTRSMAGGGSQWGLVTDTVVDRNFGDGEIVGQEFDCTNNNRDSFAGGSFGFICMYMGGNSAFPGLAALYLDNSAANAKGGFGYHYGVYVSGQPHTPGSVVEDGAFVDASNARYSIWGLAGRTHAAFIQDESESSSILTATNAHSGIGIDLSGASFASKIAFKAADDVVLTAGLLRPAQYAVASAPRCGGASRGAIIVLTDVAGEMRYRSTKIAGGGTASAPAFCNGTAWELH